MKSSQVVARLCDVLEHHKNYKVFFDNWFTTVDLLVYLAKRGILSLGTFQIRREKNLQFPDEKAMRQQGGRGKSISKCAVVDDVQVTAVKWLDNRSVTLVSTFVGEEPKMKVERYDRQKKTKIEVDAPQCISVYNKHMGFVDSIDSLLARFRIKINCRKRHYLKIFYHFLDLVAVNSWLLYRRDCQDIGMPQKERLKLWDFKSAVAHDLLEKGKDVSPKKRRSSIETQLEGKRHRGPTCRYPDMHERQDGKDHLPVFLEKRGRCKMPQCNGIINTACSKCELHLCISKARNCFYDFHTN